MNNLVDFEFQKRDAEIFKNNQLDKYDVMISAGCGLVSGLIDSFFVGMPGESKLGAWTDKMADRAVISFAKKLGWKPQKNTKSPIASAIGFLERKYKVNYDARYSKDLSDSFSMSPSNHHLKSLAHSPDIIGLFFSLLAQFTNVASYVSNGEIIFVKVDGELMLQGKSFVSKLFCGTANWFGHIMSDIAGSSGRRGHNDKNRGSGIGAPFFELFQMCNFGNIGEAQQTIAEFSTSMFEKGYDMRFFAAMKIPVILNELLLKLCWFIRRRFIDNFQTAECLKSVVFSSFAPDSLRKMLLIGHGTLCAIDLVDASVRSGGNFLNFALHMNFPAWNKIVRLSFREICNKLKISDAENAIEEIALFNKEVNDYLEALKKIDLERWESECIQMEIFSNQIKAADNEESLTVIILDSINYYGGNIPWGDENTFEEAMKDPSLVLEFK